MTDTIFDPEAARRDLTATARGQGAIADRNIARVHAEAAVSQAESLARIADLVEALVAPVAATYGPGVAEQQAAATIDQLPDYRKLVIGDVVDIAGPNDLRVLEAHVDSVGYTEGEQWVTLLDDEGKGDDRRVWSRHLAYIRHDGSVTYDVDVIDHDGKVVKTFDSVDADFEAAEADNAAAFTAARKATGKAKKGGKS